MNEFSHTLSFWFGYFVFYLVVFNFLPFVCFPIFFTPHLYSVDQHCEVFPVPSVISSVLSPCSIIPPVFQGFGSWFFTLFQVCISPILWSPLCFIFIFVFQVFISYLSPCVSAFGFNFTFKLTLFFVLISDSTWSGRLRQLYGTSLVVWCSVWRHDSWLKTWSINNQKDFQAAQRCWPSVCNVNCSEIRSPTHLLLKSFYF